MHSTDARLTRRSLLALLGGGTLTLLATACGAATPTPAPAKPAEPTAPAPKPAEPTKPAAAATKPAAEAKPQPATPTPFVPPKRPTAAPGQTVVTFWYHWGSVIGQGMEAVSRAYEQANPKVKVNSLSIGSNSIAKVLTALAAGEPPDTFNNYEVQALAIRGATIPLDDLVRSSQVVKKENYYDAVWAGGQWEGKQYALPAFENGAEMGLIWNKDLYKAAGLDPEKPPKTFEELQEHHKKITKLDAAGNLDVLGYDPMDTTGGWLENWANQMGVEWHDLKSNKIKLTQDELVWAMDYIAGYYKEIGPTKFGAFRKDFGTWGTLIPAGSFAKRKQAMLVDGYWAAGGTTKIMPDANLGVTWVPTRPNGRRIQRLGQHYAPITKDSRVRDETWKFIEFVASDQGLQTLFDVGGVLVFNKPFLKKVNTSQYRDKGLDWFVQSVSEAEAVRSKIYSPVKGEAETRWAKAVEEVYFGRKSAKEAAAEVEKQVQTALDELIH
ncbi:MAG TPA: extracellular solute-binding protein [Chloroflexota bacterium]|jgi:ABC-type glycerol-3-phosphate transport system substrate-binding protein|nr:extracellular solute-binding protein [Chloroflexota bacterium]